MSHNIDINFEAFFNLTPVASLVCTENGTILLANRAAEYLLQSDLAELQNKNILTLIPGFKLSPPDAPAHALAQAHQAIIMRHGAQQHICVQSTALPNQTKTLLLITILNDRRRQAEHALQNILHATLPSSEDFSEQTKLATLTGREREVMSLAIAGYHNKEIARALGISHRTVEIHKSRIMHKTGASNLLDLARIASASKPMASA